MSAPLALLADCSSEGGSASSTGSAAASCAPLGSDAASVKAFIEGQCYLKPDLAGGRWSSEPGRRPSATLRKVAQKRIHEYVQVHYSPAMTAWLAANRGQARPKTEAPIPEGAAMIADVFASEQGGAPVERLVMIHQKGKWYFGTHRAAAGGGPAELTGKLNDGRCVGCHIVKGGPHFTFARSANLTAALGARAPDALGSLDLPTLDGGVSPGPVFQRGNQLSAPLDSGTAFVGYYNQLTNEAGAPLLPTPLTNTPTYVNFPSQNDDVFDDPDASFVTADVCWNCHDTGGVASPMTYPATAPAGAGALYANWSLYGEWSASIMALATRDPVWQAQIETERTQNPGVVPAAIDNVCFRCHGPMGERQLEKDNNEAFSHCAFYSLDGGAPSNGNVPPECLNPDAGTGLAQAGAKYAQYGALARNGVACAFCHYEGPTTDGGAWNGTDYSPFYGPMTDAGPDAPSRETPPGPPYPFTANPQYNVAAIHGPDPVAANGGDAGVYPTDMLSEGLGLVQAAAPDGGNYLASGALCGACHVVIVPKIPKGYMANAPIPDGGTDGGIGYERPATCPSATTTFAADGNPLSDPCVGLSYEQTTYFEWVNSQFREGLPTTKTCQTCHMPPINADAPDAGQTALLGSYFMPPNEVPRTFYRHRMLGINLFVHEMFQQFPAPLGVVPDSNNTSSDAGTVAANLLNAEDSIVQQATNQAQGQSGLPSAAIKIDDASWSPTGVKVTLSVTNNAGHKFPSGAGFRRAFIELQVVDTTTSKIVWASGQPNAYGLICDGPCNAAGSNTLPSELTSDFTQLQPPYQSINKQSQAQIYELRVVSDQGKLTSRTLTLFHAVKDNRIPPLGALTPRGCTPGTTALGLDLCNMATITNGGLAGTVVPGTVSDPDYNDPSPNGGKGKDKITYAVTFPSGTLTAGLQVNAILHYQTIPPYFLVERFQDGYSTASKAYGDDTARLIYLVSRLNMNDLGLKSTLAGAPPFDVAKNWTMTLSTASASASGGGKH